MGTNDVNGIPILMVSPTPTHPQDAGNRTRIFHLAEQLRNLGGNLYFVYYEMEEADLKGMQKYWGERILIFPSKKRVLNGFTTLNSLLSKLHEWLRGIGIEQPDLDGRVRGVDDWCPPSLEKMVRRLHSKEKFEMVWVEYVFLSKILNSFDTSVLKIIDTHDIFSNRHEMMMARGMNRNGSPRLGRWRKGAWIEPTGL